MGAGASSNKRDKASVDALDAERAQAEEFRAESAGGSDIASEREAASNEGKSPKHTVHSSSFSSSSPTKPGKRRPMPIPAHVFEDDGSLSIQTPAFPRTPKSPQAAAGFEKFQSLLSIDDDEFVMVARQGRSPPSASSPLHTLSSPRGGGSGLIQRVSSRSGPRLGDATRRKARGGRKLTKGQRFNSTSSWYSVRTTMGSAPKEATVRCIATVLLRHMAAHKRASSASAGLIQRKYKVFDDSPDVYSESKEQDHHPLTADLADSNSQTGKSVLRSSLPSRLASKANKGVEAKHDDVSDSAEHRSYERDRFRVTRGMPSVNRIREFVNYVFTKAQLEIDGLIIAFIYLERLLATASRDGANLLYEKNWRTLCFVSLMLASKIWDDFSMDNAVSDFLFFLPPSNPALHAYTHT